jgi:FkbM family methyltransferase
MSDKRIDGWHDALRRFGMDVVRYQASSHHLARRASLLRTHGVDLVVDVGASDGDYANELRRLGYRGRIASFEPLPVAMARLNRRRRKDSSWTAYNIALGDEDAETTIHVAGNSSSSSILEMLPNHERLAPGSANIGDVRVTVRRLDGMADEVIGNARRPFLKVDTQG